MVALAPTMLSRRVTSQGTATWAFPGNCSRVRARPCSSRSIAATSAPARARLMATARPMPPPPPVTTQTRPDRPSQSDESCSLIGKSSGAGLASLANCDRHFAKMRPARHVGKRLFGLLERESPVDDGLHAIDGDGIDHRLKIFGRSHGYALQALLLHDDQRNSKFRRWRSGKHADECDRAADPGRADRLVEGSHPADLHDKINPVTSDLPRLLSPVGRSLVVDGNVGAELAQTLDLRLA